MSKKSIRQPARKKKTNAEKKIARAKNSRFIPIAKPQEVAMKNFNWDELNNYHNECESMFIVAHPVVNAIRNEALLEQIKADGNYEQFMTLATQLNGQLPVYRNDLDAIAAEYKGRVVNDDNLLEEIGKAISVAEQYRQWLDSFRSVIVEGLMPDMNDIMLTAHAKLAPVTT